MQGRIDILEVPRPVVPAAQLLLSAVEMLGHQKTGKLSDSFPFRKRAFEDAIGNLKVVLHATTEDAYFDLTPHAKSAFATIVSTCAKIRKWIEYREDGLHGEKFKKRWISEITVAVGALSLEVEGPRDNFGMLETPMAIETQMRIEAENPSFVETSADTGADSRKRTIPRSSDVKDLCDELARKRGNGKTEIDISRDFFGGNEKKAQNALRSARRHPDRYKPR